MEKTDCAFIQNGQCFKYRCRCDDKEDKTECPISMKKTDINCDMNMGIIE